MIYVGQKTGAVNSIDAAGIRAAHDFTSALKSLKTYQQFPTGRNGQ
jgi:hypothetical protein